ncbi:hypothetical protein DFJ74DRAFT_770597 [Hyaloraphidium curvatum]|nr:hypothetical protein DFJ74DRAFT_770597 [Hyaloraphidium curvatum]
MAEIGPAIPAHLLRKSSDDGDGGGGSPGSADGIGPQLPPSLKRKLDDRDASPPPKPAAEDSDDDDYAPALPPDLADRPPAPKRRVAGPTLPPSDLPAPSPAQHPAYGYADDDDVVGPSAAFAAAGPDDEEEALRRMEEIDRRARAAKEAAEGGRGKEEKLERGEWMLVPPEAKRLGMTVEMQSRGFSKTTKEYDLDRSSWTDTPADKERKFKEELASRGKKKAKEEEPQLTMRDLEQAKIAEELNKSRGKPLLESHTSSYVGSRDFERDDASKRKFDRDKDLAARRIDPKKRQDLINSSRELDSKFGRGQYL